MIDAILNEVRAAEKEADAIVEGAKRKASSIVSEARVKAAQLLKESDVGIARKSAQVAEKQQEKLQGLREKAIAEGSDVLKSLRKSAEKKAGAAVDIVLEAFENGIKG